MGESFSYWHQFDLGLACEKSKIDLIKSLAKKTFFHFKSRYQLNIFFIDYTIPTLIFFLRFENILVDTAHTLSIKNFPHL